MYNTKKTFSVILLTIKVNGVYCERNASILRHISHLEAYKLKQNQSRMKESGQTVKTAKKGYKRVFIGVSGKNIDTTLLCFFGYAL